MSATRTRRTYPVVTTVEAPHVPGTACDVTPSGWCRSHRRPVRPSAPRTPEWRRTAIFAPEGASVTRAGGGKF
jgi:hypothetical protein